jgi:hypothetical protein
MSVRFTPIAIVLWATVAGFAQAQTPFSASIHAATTGVGVEGQYKVNDWLAVRADGDWFSYSRSFNSNDIRYNGRATWSTAGAFADLHPFKNAFFVSGGAYFGDRKVTLTGVPATNQTVGGVVLTPVQIGQLNGKGTLSSTAPFGGLGYDGSFRAKSGLFFKGLVGVAFSDDPRISLTASGPAANTPVVQQYLATYVAQEQAQVQHDARFLKTYPVASLGLGWKF